MTHQLGITSLCVDNFSLLARQIIRAARVTSTALLFCNAQTILQGECAAVQAAQSPAEEESAAEESAAPAAAPEQVSAPSEGAKKGWQLSPEGDAAILHGKP